MELAIDAKHVSMRRSHTRHSTGGRFHREALSSFSALPRAPSRALPYFVYAARSPNVPDYSFRPRAGGVNRAAKRKGSAPDRQKNAQGGCASLPARALSGSCRAAVARDIALCPAGALDGFLCTAVARDIAMATVALPASRESAELSWLAHCAPTGFASRPRAGRWRFAARK